MAWTLTEGARGHVVGPGFRVPAVVVQISPASFAVRYTPPDRAERTEWFNSMPGKRYLMRHGDGVWRVEPEGGE